MKRIVPIIFGIQSVALSHAETMFFKDYVPLGFILFRRNLQDIVQVRALIQQLKEISAYPIICIDEEGGKVSRLEALSSSYCLPKISSYTHHPDGLNELTAHYQHIGMWLYELGITVNCAPVLDLRTPNTASFLAERCIDETPERVSEWGKTIIETLCQHHIIPVMKHVPGHGIAEVDSHYTLPCIPSTKDLQPHLAPFQANAHCPWVMSSHLYLEQYAACVTYSPEIVEHIVRGEIGASGFLVTDDLMMSALASQSLTERCTRALEAGHDGVLMCAGTPKDWYDAVEKCPGFTESARNRLEKSLNILGI